MLQLITDRKQIVKHHNQIKSKLNPFISGRLKILIGFKGDSSEIQVNFSKELGIWWAFQDWGKHFWNPFGLGLPFKNKSNSIICEINYVKSGRYTSRSGAFAKNDFGEVVLLHNGRIGGGRKGIGQSLFLNNFLGKTLDVQMTNSIKRYAPVGAIYSNRFPYQVAHFVKEIGRIKQLIKETKSFSTKKEVKKIFTKEFTGKKKYIQSNIVSAQCDHGLVVNTFRKLLKERGFRVANDTNRDLYILGKQNSPKIVFEFKTDISTQSLYTAVGQLLLNNLQFAKKTKLVLVVPGKLSAPVNSILKKLNINCLIYAWKKENPVFESINSILR